MDNQRFLIWAALAFILWLNYQTWQKDYAPPPPPKPAATETPAPSASPNALPPLPTDSPTTSASPSATPAAGTAAAPPLPTAPVETTDAPNVHVVTDVLDIEISTRGGDLIRADLPKYPKVKNEPAPVRLLNTGQPGLFVIQSGLRAADQAAEPTHLAMFKAAAAEYRLKAGDKQLVVPLVWTDEHGVTVTKTYTFEPGSYRIDLAYDVKNASDKEWKGASYVQIVRHYEHLERSYFNVETYSYRGPAIHDGTKYRRLNVEKKEDANFKASIKDGWSAALQHHFVVAAIPPPDAAYDYQLSVNANNDFTLSHRGPLLAVPANGEAKFTERLFVGPKLQAQLETTGHKLELTADYGNYLSVIARPLFLLLDFVHTGVRNWGLAIIIVTFLIKLVFYRLTASSGRSMAKMRNLAPKIKTLQERYKDDREQLSRQMMEIYKKEKVNPVAGCLPMLIQIPFFISFYWVLVESVEMRQAPFFGWITDLSARDPFFILPVLMGGAMFAQFKLQPMPSADPIQQKIFMFMPLIMAGTMLFFPSGLVLYWLTNTLLSMAQQWRINTVLAREQQTKS